MAGEPLRLARLRPPGAWLTRNGASAGTRHWLQLVRGIAACRTTHALLHDADVFLSDASFLRTHAEQGITDDRVCYGVSPAWDDWYRENGYGHVVATWELLFDLGWARSFNPWMHRANEGAVNGRVHIFDTMFLPQCLTPAARVGQQPTEWGFIHFNYVVSTYRSFQGRTGRFEDDGFKLLLIRLLVEAYGMSDWRHDVPSLAGLVAGLFERDAPVTYQAAKTRANYGGFRRKLDALLNSGLVPSTGVEKVARALDLFDEALA